MMHRTSTIVFSRGLSLAVALASTALAAAQAPPQTGHFRLRLSLVQDEVSVAEPVRLLLEAQVEDGPVAGLMLLEPAANRGQVTVTGVGATRKYQFRDLLGISPRVSLDMLPPRVFAVQETGARSQSELWLSYSRREGRYILAEPGRYQLQVFAMAFYGTEYDTAKIEQVSSNVASVTVREPADAESAELWQLPLQALLFLGRENSLSLLTHDHADSTYAHYARFALAADEAATVTDRTLLLRKVVDSPGAPLQLLDPALLRLADLLWRDGRLEDARTAYERVLQLPTASSTSKQAARKLLDALGLQMRPRPK